MIEVASATWPATRTPTGTVPPKSVNSTALIAKTYGVIKKLPTGAVTYQYADQALNLLKPNTDIYGAKYKPITVHVTPKGN